MSQLELAERVGVSMQTISNVERGEGVSVPVVAVLARELAVPVPSLFGAAQRGVSAIDQLVSMLSEEDLLIVTALVRAWVEHRRRAAPAGRLPNPRGRPSEAGTKAGDARRRRRPAKKR
jgi:transcriptional regulator with XRE-family HTH domain